MTGRLRSAVRRHPVLSAGFGLALAVAALFAVRASLSAVYWSDPGHRNQPVEEWMTPRYVAHSWNIPRATLTEAIGEGFVAGKRQTLADIAREKGVPVTEVIDEVEAALGRAGADDLD